MAQSKVLVVCCSDPRLVLWLDDYLSSREFRPMEIDRILNPGAIPGLAYRKSFLEREVYLQNIKLLVEAHHIPEIILVTHEDCAAIGGSKAFDNPEAETKDHQQMLEVARQNIINYLRLLSLEIKMIYVPRQDFDRLNNNWKKS